METLAIILTFFAAYLMVLTAIAVIEEYRAELAELSASQRRKAQR